MKPGEWIQGLWPARHDDPKYEPDLRVIPLGVAVDTRGRDNLGVPLPAGQTLGTMHATMAFIPADPASPRSIGAWSAAFPLIAREEGKVGGIALRARASDAGPVYDGADESLSDLLADPLFADQRRFFDRHLLPGDEALAVGTTEIMSPSAYDAGMTAANAGSGAPYVMPIGDLPLALPRADEAADLEYYTSTALDVGLDSRGKPAPIAGRWLLSSVLVVPAGTEGRLQFGTAGKGLSLNGTSATGGLIDLDLAGGPATIARTGAAARIATHRLPAVIVGGTGISDPHGDAAHVSTLAPFISLANPRRDSPLDFEDAPDSFAREGTIPHRVHLQHDETGDRWRWHVTIPVYQDDDEPPPENPEDPGDPETPPPGGPGAPPETPGGPEGVPGIPLTPPPLPPEEPIPDGKGGLVVPLPWDREAPLRPSAGSPHEWHAPGLALRAVPMTSAGAADYRAPNGRMTRAQVAEARARPVTLHIEGYGYETAGGRFVLNRHDGQRRYRYAESSQGGAVVLPPELGIEHHRDSWNPRGITPSTTYLTMLSTHVRLGFGLPDPATGGLKNGFSIYEKGSNILSIENHDANGVDTLVATMASDGSLDLRSGDLKTTDAEIDGALNHDGSTIGFFGTTPAAQQTGAWTPAGGLTEDTELRGVVAALVVALKAYGIIADA